MLELSNFSYELPDSQIARYPLAERDASKLLVYRSGVVEHKNFKNIADFLPKKWLMVFNNTQVIPARLLFSKATGAIIEIFLLQPVLPSVLIQDAMQAQQWSVWECMIGNKKRWKINEVLEIELPDGKLTARLITAEKNRVELRWTSASIFAEVVEQAGKIPLPPYLRRQAESSDTERYQTIYSQKKGAVAAPTAGLHFTENILDNLRKKEIDVQYLTLHVGAGTFQPIKINNPALHTMHAEQVVISTTMLEKLLNNIGKTIAVGTTSLRAMESMYWWGVKCLQNPHLIKLPIIEQEYAYSLPENDLPSTEYALKALLNFLKNNNIEETIAETAIYIMPTNYKLRVVRGLVTNFHQPASTLILLVAALVGEHWQNIYQEAIAHNYRFLSYGDSSLLLP